MAACDSPTRPRGRVIFVGAGPGAADLLTFRAAAAIGSADLVIWAASLVSPDVLTHARAGAECIESSALTLEDVRILYKRAASEGLVVARVHSGDPGLYGAIAEQLTEVEALDLDWEIVPGVSSMGAVAALAGVELTAPQIAQSVIITRLATNTPMPEGEDLAQMARHGTTMALFLSAKRPRALQAALLQGGYPADTPCIVAYRATWPDEEVFRCTLGELAAKMRATRRHKTGLVLIGPALAANHTRSRLYDPAFSHEYRQARRGERGALPSAALDDDDA